VDRQQVGTDSASIATTVDARSIDSTWRGFPGRDDKTLFQQFILSTMASNSIDNLFASIDVNYRVDGAFRIGGQTLDLIYFPKLSLDAQVRREVLDRKEALDVPKSLLLINKARFQACSRK